MLMLLVQESHFESHSARLMFVLGRYYHYPHLVGEKLNPFAQVSGRAGQGALMCSDVPRVAYISLPNAFDHGWSGLAQLAQGLRYSRFYEQK